MQSVKRATSVSVTDLQFIDRTAVSDNRISNDNSGEIVLGIKKLAISVNGKPTTQEREQKFKMQAPPPQIKLSDSMKNGQYHRNTAVSSVLSRDMTVDGIEVFKSKFDVVKYIGKGGFSTVHLCRHKSNGVEYAVKVVDLRALRMKERFNPSRLRREVDIIRQLRHPNIIQFEEVFENFDQLMIVMEYFPGQELFDVILARKYFSEDDAKPIFAQIARALYYLHCLNIIHRDVKPENILVSNNIDPLTGKHSVKLLDFGLSKNAGAGSAAKTFVGTPCYLAPEVEYTSKGIGGTYGLPADCWSLGAVLYVMLVARFPEFEKDASGKVVVKLAPHLWSNISSNAHRLIRGLMESDPGARLTIADALQSPWLGSFGAQPEELHHTANALKTLSKGLQDLEEQIAAAEMEADSAFIVQNNRNSSMTTANAIVSGRTTNEDTHQPNNVQNVKPPLIMINDVDLTGGSGYNQAVVVRQTLANQMGVLPVHDNSTPNVEQLQLVPLLNLQRSIAVCFEDCHSSYLDMPDVAQKVRRGAALCRDQLTESTKMLRQVEQTASSVLDMFPDLELAIEEGEPQLAMNFFSTVKTWVVELRELVSATQQKNKLSMDQIQQIVEESTVGLTAKKKNQPKTTQIPRQLLNMILQRIGGAAYPTLIENGPANDSSSTTSAIEASHKVDLSAEQVFELFDALFCSPMLTAPPPAISSKKDGDEQQKPDEFEYMVTEPSGSTIEKAYSIDSIDSDGELRSREPAVKVVPNRPPSSQGSSPSRSTKLPDGNSNLRAQLSPVNLTDVASSAAAQTLLFPTTSDSAVRHESLESADISLSSVRDRDGDAMDTATVGEESKGRPQPMLYFHNHDSLDSHLPRSEQIDSSIPFGNPEPAQTRLLFHTGPVPVSPTSAAASKLADALDKLRQVDMILEQLGVFWANTEVVLELLTKKGQHVEHFIGFSNKPRLMQRFLERMEEYKRFWENVSIMCRNYLMGMQNSAAMQGGSVGPLDGANAY